MKLLQSTGSTPVMPDVESTLSAVASPKEFGSGMVRLKSLNKLAQRITQRESGKEDLIVPFSDIAFVGDMGAVMVKGFGRVLLSELAFSQLCTRLRIPVDYMIRCPLDLRNSNLSYWVEQNDERKVMLRIRKFPERHQDTSSVGVLRAVLPQTYEPIDNQRILDWCSAAIQQHDGKLGIQSYRVSEVSTHIRLLFADPSVVAQDGDLFFFGVHVSDSEVGERGFAADLVSFRPEQETGFLHLVDGDHLTAQRHIHIDFKLLRQSFSDSFTLAKDNMEAVTEVITRAVMTPVRDAQSYIRRWVRHYRLTNDFAETVVHAYEAEPLPNKYGVAIAIARAATGLPTMDERVNTEAMVGAYLLEGA